MKKMPAILVFFLSIPFMTSSFAWNLAGHRLIAQIAFDQLDEKTRVKYIELNHSLDDSYGREDIIAAAAWLDEIKYKYGVHWYDTMHYIDKPFTKDNINLPEVSTVNAVWALNSAVGILANNNSPAPAKAFALRLLMHVTGDLHQPLHAANRVSFEHPKGDAGGNLFPLAANPIAPNLHAYWDSGGGLLKGLKHRKYSHQQLRQDVSHIPCDMSAMDLNFERWALESHTLAIKQAYHIKSGTKPSAYYQRKTRETARKRIALAGCRLAALLKQLADNR